VSDPVGSAAKHALKEGLLWASAALAGLALVYFYGDIVAAFGPRPGRAALETAAVQRESQGFAREVRLRADDRGHFVFDAAVNERPVTLMADTGATLVVLTFEDAERLGLSPGSLDFSGRVQTANGVSRVAPITLDRVRVDDITLHDIPAAIAERGALGVNLLGMSFLSRLRSFQIQGRELILVQ
jgi:aspartyl protease family protein